MKFEYQDKIIQCIGFGLKWQNWIDNPNPKSNFDFGLSITIQSSNTLVSCCIWFAKVSIFSAENQQVELIVCQSVLYIKQYLLSLKKGKPPTLLSLSYNIFFTSNFKHLSRQGYSSFSYNSSYWAKTVVKTHQECNLIIIMDKQCGNDSRMNLQ